MTEKSKKSKGVRDSPVRLFVTPIRNSPHQKYLKKTSEAQKDLMIQYFETHEGAIEVVSANNTDSEVKRKIWSDVAKLLNQVEGGVEKNDLKWSKTWADMKLYTKNRARTAKQGHVLAQSRKPSDLDRRILRVTGHEDLLKEWEASIGESDADTTDIYEKIYLDTTEEHETVVTEGTDYEYIDEEELVNVENDEEGVVRIKSYFKHEPEAEYEYKSPSQTVSNKRKQPKQDLVEIEEEIVDAQTHSPPGKRSKQTFIENDEDQTQDELEHDDHTYEQDPMIGAINNLAHALNNVASALTSFADVAKTFTRK